jgi:hypothetical protein
VWLKERATTASTPRAAATPTHAISAAALDAAYGLAGRRGRSSVIGCSASGTAPYTSAEPASTIRVPAASASTSRSVPVALASHVPTGSPKELATLACPARWKTASGRASATAAAMEAAPVTSSASQRAPAGSPDGGVPSSEPANTSTPSATSERTR